MQPTYKQKYDYQSAGFNRFYRRTLASAAATDNLSTLPGTATRRMNFDDLQVSGGLGDTLKIGNIRLDGKMGRISVVDDQGNEIVRIGDVES